MPILAPLAAGLPGGYRYLAVRDLAAEIEWAKARRHRSRPTTSRAAEAQGRDGPLPPDLMAGLYRRYETALERAGLIDFEDMLARTIELIESDDGVAAEVRDRYRWFSVDEYQDTNPLQAGAARRVARRPRRPRRRRRRGPDDLHVHRGDQRLPDRVRRPAIRTRGRSRSRPTTARPPRCSSWPTASWPPAGRRPTNGSRARRRGRQAARGRACRGGPAPSIGGFASDEAELAGMIGAIRDLARAGTPHGSMAVLVRTNAQLPPIESALGAAGIGFHVRGEGFFARPEVRRAIARRPLARPGTPGDGPARRPAGRGLRARARRPSRPSRPEGEAAGERHAARRHAARAGRGPRPRRIRRPDRPAFLAEVERRTAIEAGGDADRRRAADLPPRQGPRVGRGLPAGARGGHAADPPGRPSPPSSPRSAGSCTSGSPGRAGTCGCRGRPGEPARPAARAGAAGRASSTDWCRAPAAPGRAVGGRRRRGDRPSGTRRPAVDPADRSPLSNALRAWRTARARTDAVAPFIVFHDTTIEAIAEPPPAIDRRAPAGSRGRPDQARSLRRGDHRRRRPRGLTRRTRAPMA